MAERDGKIKGERGLDIRWGRVERGKSRGRSRSALPSSSSSDSSSAGDGRSGVIPQILWVAESHACGSDSSATCRAPGVKRWTR